MKQNLFTLMTFALSFSVLTLVVSCGEDEEVTPNTQQNGNQNGQGGYNEGNGNQDDPTAPIIVTVDADGKADGGHNFTKIDETNFYIDDIKYTATKGDLVVSGYNDAFFKGEAKIITQLNYGGREMQVKEIKKAAFSGCKGLTAVKIPSFITYIGEFTFSDCTGLISVDIPEGITRIETSAFSGCKSLTSISIPTSVTSIGSGAFSGCTGLTSATIPSSVTSIGEAAFEGCRGLSNVHITDLESWSKVSFPIYDGYHLYINGEEIKDMVIPSSITNIRKGAFCYCAGLTSVIISDGVTSIGDEAFYCCYGLTSVTIPSSVISIGKYAFTLTALTSVTIPASVTSIGNQAFQGCSGLLSITINSNSILSKDYSQPNSYSLSFIFGNQIKSYILGENITSIGNNVFQGCTGLTDVYCYAATVPSTASSAFIYLSVNGMTLHVPASAIDAYKTTEPWSGFGSIVAIE